MMIFFVILIVIVCGILGLIILVQNPKGGGLSSSIGGIGNQFMGVKQTTDVLEKGTWIFAAVIGLLCLFSPVFIPTGSSSRNPLLEKVNTRPTANPNPVSPAPLAPSSTPTTPAK